MRKISKEVLINRSWNGLKIIKSNPSMQDTRMIKIGSPLYPLDIDLESAYGTYLTLKKVRITIEEIK